jgi:hypothetical protein
MKQFDHEAIFYKTKHKYTTFKSAVPLNSLYKLWVTKNTFITSYLI